MFFKFILVGVELSKILDIFTNREISLIIWGIIALIFVISKNNENIHKSFVKLIKILFSAKIMIPVFIFFLYSTVFIVFLNRIGFWNIYLLKDSIFWMLFVQLPLMSKVVSKCDNNNFFKKLVVESISLTVILEFVVNFWTGNLLFEFFFVPISVLAVILYLMVERDQKYANIKKLFEWGKFLVGIFVLCFLFDNFIKEYRLFFSIDTLREFLLPIILVLVNIPLMYILALYCKYELIKMRVEFLAKENVKFGFRAFRIIGLNLNTVSYVDTNTGLLFSNSKNKDGFNHDLHILHKKLETQLGENYMNRSKFYLFASISLFVIAIIGIIACNSDVSLKDVLTLNFIIDFVRLKSILTYILSFALVCSVILIFYSIGFKKKKYEEISYLKTIACHELFFLIKKQMESIDDKIDLNNPIEFHMKYGIYIYEIYKVCKEVTSNYSQVFSYWELELLKNLFEQTNLLCFDLDISTDDSTKLDVYIWVSNYQEKIKNSPQSEKYNYFLDSIQRKLDKYVYQIKLIGDEFMLENLKPL